jgi:hypothetical protein
MTEKNTMIKKYVHMRLQDPCKAVKMNITRSLRRIILITAWLPAIMAVPPGHAQEKDNSTNLTIQNFRESLRPQGFVLHDPDWYFWGCSPILDDGVRWVLFFIANTGLNDMLHLFPSSQLIGMAASESFRGPCKFLGNDGCYLLYFKSVKHSFTQKGLEGFHRRVSMGVVRSRRPGGLYFMHPEPITKNKVLIEDGNAFKLQGKICLLTTVCEGEHNGGGQIFYSDDGIKFNPDPVLAYENITRYMEKWDNPSHEWSDCVLQMPKLLFDKEDVPTQLYCPCGTAPEGEKGTGVFLF